MMKIKSNQTRTYDGDGYKKRAACLCFRNESEEEVSPRLEWCGGTGLVNKQFATLPADSLGVAIPNEEKRASCQRKAYIWWREGLHRIAGKTITGGCHVFVSKTITILKLTLTVDA